VQPWSIAGATARPRALLARRQPSVRAQERWRLPWRRGGRGAARRARVGASPAPLLVTRTLTVALLSIEMLGGGAAWATGAPQGASSNGT
jgi:hypothetical protein